MAAAVAGAKLADDPETSTAVPMTAVWTTAAPMIDRVTRQR